MQKTLSLSSLLLLAVGATAQNNFVINGDFSNGLTGWTQGGTSYNPQVETFDVTGLGATSSFGCGPGGSVYLPPHAPNWIEQSILQVPSVAYEFRADVCITGASGNAHAGLCYVDVNGVEVGRIDFLGFTGNKPERNRLCFRYTTTSAGLVPVRLNFQRPPYIYNSGTPRLNVTNVSIAFASGPSFAIADNRQVGMSLPFVVQGGAAAAGAPFAVLLAAAEQVPPIQLPGVSGLLALDPLTLAVLYSGTLDTTGGNRTSFSVPNLPVLTQGATWFQAGTVVGGQIVLGTHHGLAFVL
jgi:hypothetical protein